MTGSDLRPTRVRHAVILFAAALAVITYLQRVAISQAAPLMQKELGLDKFQMGLAFSAFVWMYAVFEIPGGVAADRGGPPKVLSGIVVVWSFCLAATGWVWNLPTLIAARGLFGVFQAGCFPNVARVFANWLSGSERVRAQGIMWLAARWGGALSPLLVMFLIRHMSWRGAFGVFGLFGLAWVGFFFWWFRDSPRDHAAVNQAELDMLPSDSHVTLEHARIPWRKFLASRTVWLLWGQYMCLNFGWQFYVTWLPTYLYEARGVGLEKAALLAAFPLFFGGLGSLSCGFVSSWIDRLTPSVKISRRVLACSGFAGAAVCFAVAHHIKNPVWAVVALGAASFANDLVMPPSWAACMDVGGKLCGTLAGSMNMMGGFVAALAPIILPLILAWTAGDWALTFYVSAGIYFLGTFFWLALDPTEPIDPDATQ